MSQRREDPVLKSARREAIVVALAYVAAFAYTVTYCYLFGYHRPAESLTFVLGFPDWIFWGLVVPWVLCVLFSFWFSYFFMKDENLGEDREE